jgi:hypothetical protein
MAIKTNSVADIFKVISRHDDAIPEDLTDEEFELYQATLDETHLRMASEPTRFVVRRTLSFTAQQEVTNQQVAIGRDGKPKVNFGFILEEIRCALIDIENPADLPEDQKLLFKRDADGFASKELIAKLNAIGIVSELYTAKQTKHKEIPSKK